MNKHGQRRKKESLHCKSDFSGAKLHFFVHYSTNIQRQLWISPTPKVQKSGLWHQENHTQHQSPHKSTSASSKMFSAGPGTRKQSSRFRETGRKAKSRPEGCATTSHS